MSPVIIYFSILSSCFLFSFAALHGFHATAKYGLGSPYSCYTGAPPALPGGFSMAASQGLPCSLPGLPGLPSSSPSSLHSSSSPPEMKFSSPASLPTVNNSASSAETDLQQVCYGHNMIIKKTHTSI